MNAPLHILLIEHDLTIRLALAHVLKNRGADVHTCISLKSPSTLFSATLLMSSSPISRSAHDRVNGLNLLKLVRKLHPKTHVIIMTACGAKEVEAELKHYGGTYWPKSWDFEELLISLTSVRPAPQPI